MSDLNLTRNRGVSGVRRATVATGGNATPPQTAVRSKVSRALSLSYANSIPGTGDIKVLNYALLLEEFEAALYQAAVAKLPSLGVTAGNAFYDRVAEFAQVEVDHATYLRTAITAAGGPVIGKFNYDTSSITGAANARVILELLLQVEATGVRAYLGAIPLLAVGSAYLPIAAAIEGTEARHTSVLTIVRNQQYGTNTDVAPLIRDNNPTGVLTTASFKYENINPTGYNTLKPDEGVAAIDANLAPDTVLSAVGVYFVSAAS